MDEPALDFEGVTLSPKKEVVRVFYKELWVRASKSPDPKYLPRRLYFPRLAGPDARRSRAIRGLRRPGDRRSGPIHHRYFDDGRGRQSRQRQDAIPRLPPQGIVRRAAERPARVVDRHADLHLRGLQGARPSYVLSDIYGLIRFYERETEIEAGLKQHMKVATGGSAKYSTSTLIIADFCNKICH